MEQAICQSCAMPLTSDDMFGTNADGSINEDYCKWCYTDGEFTYKDKASLIDFLIGHMPNPDQQPENVRRVQYDQYLSLLKHWK